MPAALIATIERDKRLIRLDPAVRPGTRIDGPGEKVLLHCTSTGHAADTAVLMARTLRSMGWLVTVAEPPAPETLLGTVTEAPASVGRQRDALLGMIGSASATPPHPTEVKRNFRMKRCVTCGFEKRVLGHHVRQTGHDRWEYIEDQRPEGPPENAR